MIQTTFKAVAGDGQVYFFLSYEQHLGNDNHLHLKFQPWATLQGRVRSNSV